MYSITKCYLRWNEKTNPGHDNEQAGRKVVTVTETDKDSHEDSHEVKMTHRYFW